MQQIYITFITDNAEVDCGVGVCVAKISFLLLDLVIKHMYIPIHRLG